MRWPLPAALFIVFIISLAIQQLELLDPYVQLVLMYIGINVILTLSLNVINGYMGEFSVGHAGFMAVGAYTASVLTVRVVPPELAAWLFPLAVIAGGLAAALVGLVVAFPSFKTRGDYLAIVTLAFGMIIKSVIENIDYLGGPRGFLGMERLSTLPWVFFFAAVSVWVIRNLIYSKFGRGIISIREDETASDIMGVNTKEVKMMAFVISAFFAGIAGALFAHVLQFINPRSFDIIKSTDILIMVYLGGIGSITGSIIGAVVYTVLLEVLRFLGVWRMVFMPLVLVMLMLFRPTGIMGLKELKWFIPFRDRFSVTFWREKKGGN